MSKKEVTLIGGGLVGSLLSLLLRKKGYEVSVFEKREDPRKLKEIGKVGEGRSINLAISVRGFHGLSLCGLKEEVQKQAIPMPGRMLHQLEGEVQFQAYGQKKEDAIYSFSRSGLNSIILNAAEKEGVKLYFNSEVKSVDLDQKKIKFIQNNKEHKYQRIIGTDGSASVLRTEIENKTNKKINSSLLSHGYKELVMQADSDQKYRMEKNALHIWPRGEFMLIALPNEDGSFTCTLFMPFEKGEYNFAELKSKEKIKDFFEKYFLDFTKRVPNYCEQFMDNPLGKMVTLKSDKWNYNGSALLMGDASHAIVPFFGQGMNCGFEDCGEFLGLIEKNGFLDNEENDEKLFQQFFKNRKPNTDAIADLAVENFTEMSSKTADPLFLLQKKMEALLYSLYPDIYIPRYTLISFSRTPYKVAEEIGLIQKEILNELSKNIKTEMDMDFDFAEKLFNQKLVPVMSKYKEWIRWI